jgi:hypothetical protein
VEDEGDEEVVGVARLFSAEEEAVEVEAMPPLCEVSPVSDEELSDNEKAAELLVGEDDALSGGLSDEDEDDDDTLRGGLYDNEDEDEDEDEEMAG